MSPSILAASNSRIQTLGNREWCVLSKSGRAAAHTLCICQIWQRRSVLITKPSTASNAVSWSSWCNDEAFKCFTTASFCVMAVNCLGGCPATRSIGELAASPLRDSELSALLVRQREQHRKETVLGFGIVGAQTSVQCSGPQRTILDGPSKDQRLTLLQACREQVSWHGHRGV